MNKDRSITITRSNIENEIAKLLLTPESTDDDLKNAMDILFEIKLNPSTFIEYLEDSIVGRASRFGLNLDRYKYMIGENFNKKQEV